MPKRILLLTFFYPPDLSAGSFRAQALVEALREQSGDGVQIDVLTTQPNRYHCHASVTDAFEQEGRVRVRRIQLPAHKSGFVDQAKSFAAFTYQADRLAREDRYDLVIATSSRLMMAVLGAWIAYRQRAALYLDIRDLFVKNVKELFRVPVGKPLSKLFGVLERWAFRRADKINLVSPGFLKHFQDKYPNRHFSLYSNGIDDDFLKFPQSPVVPTIAHRPLQVLYAGNIGDGQGLHLIVPELAQRLQGRVHFRVVGAGGRVQMLREAVASRRLDNVELIAPMPRDQLLDIYHQADVLFLHLNDFRAFRRVLPSKLFEYAATGKPIWAGVAGYASDFLAAEVSNAVVFAPCNVDQAVLALERLRLEQMPRPEFVKRFARSLIMQPMAKDVLTLLKDR